ncbi:MAG: hypothetical protein CR972_04510 [Candidatus Moraniibacteriota bacterium]|nr:MAG: hypothetical protein CR972_04510 [Candidatus Moranbacteria bacterium]
MKYGELNLGQVEAIVNKLGGMSGVRALLQDDLIIQSKQLPFSKNEHGHCVFTITGLNITGKQDKARMEESHFRVSKYAGKVLASTNNDSYDKNHRLEDGKEYNIVLIPGCEVTKNRTTANLQAYARSFGYEVPLAGVIPRIREVVSDRQMKQMDIWHIVALHTPIKDTDDDPVVLSAGRDGNGCWIRTAWDNPVSTWNDYGAFAFVVPKS